MKKLLILFLFASILARGQTTMTDAEMTVKANQIKNETVPGANTKERFAYLYQRLIDSKINLSQLSYVVASGADIYTATITPVPPTLTGLRAFVLFTNANTGASTINFNGLGAKALINNDGSALSSGDINAGEVKLVSYNGTAFQLIGGSGGGGSGSVTSVSVTTANGVSGTVATATTTPAITLSLGAITPSTVNGVTLSGSDSPTLAVTGTSTISGANTGDNTANTTSNTYADAKVADAINNGTTTIAPSQNAVYDALLNKARVWNVESYGAQHDYETVSDANITSGTAIVTSATAGFVAADVGKTIRLSGAGAAGIDLITTILSRQSATQITINTNASTTITAKKIEWGTDDTPLIQAAINACFAAGGGTVYFPNGTYYIAGALITSLNSVNPNCQLYIPLSSDTDAIKTIHLKGESIPNIQQRSFITTTMLNTQGVILFSPIVGSGTDPAVLGTPFMPVSGFIPEENYTGVFVENISIQVKSKTGTAHVANIMSAFFLKRFSKCRTLNNVAFTESDPNSSAEPTAGYGFHFPQSTEAQGAGGLQRMNMVYGYFTGFMYYEHENLEKMIAVACVNGHEFTSNSGLDGHLNVGQIATHYCRYSIKFTQFSDVNISFYTEDYTTADKWFQNTANFLFTGTPTVNGSIVGSRLNVNDVPATLVYSGSFNGNLSVRDLNALTNAINGFSISGAYRTRIQNKHTGTASSAGLQLTNNTTTSALALLGSGYTTSGNYTANTLILQSSSGTNLLLESLGSGNVITQTNAVQRMSVGSTGVNITGAPAGSSTTDNFLNVTGTQPTSLAATMNAVNFQITGAGSSSQSNIALRTNYVAGYTGSSLTSAAFLTNNNAGTNTTAPSMSGVFGNSGVNSKQGATTTGHNYGTIGQAEGGNLSVGVIGQAQTTKNSATNIGVVGLARNSGTSPQEIAGYFSLVADATALPSSLSGALIANNGSTTQNIFSAQDNGTDVFTIADGGLATSTNNIKAVNHVPSYSTTATAAGTTTLTVSSNYVQQFTGSTTQTVVLPVVTTLSTGHPFRIVNTSSGVVTVQSSGANSIKAMAANSYIDVWVINTGGGTGTASWNWIYTASINN